MKTAIVSAAFFFLCLCTAQAQYTNSSYKYLPYSDADIRYADSYLHVVDMLEEDGYTISTEKYGYLKEGEIVFSDKTFSEGLQYKIVGISNDSHVNDIDLFLYNEDGTLYSSDESSDAVAIINFYPSFTREMRIKIKNADSDTPYDASLCRFVVAYK